MEEQYQYDETNMSSGIINHLTREDVKWDDHFMKGAAIILIVLCLFFGFETRKTRIVRLRFSRRNELVITDSEDDLIEPDPLSPADSILLVAATPNMDQYTRRLLSKNHITEILRQAKRKFRNALNPAY